MILLPTPLDQYCCRHQCCCVLHGYQSRSGPHRPASLRLPERPQTNVFFGQDEEGQLLRGIAQILSHCSMSSFGDPAGLISSSLGTTGTRWACPPSSLPCSCFMQTKLSTTDDHSMACPGASRAIQRRLSKSEHPTVITLNGSARAPEPQANGDANQPVRQAAASWVPHATPSTCPNPFPLLVLDGKTLLSWLGTRLGIVQSTRVTQLGAPVCLRHLPS